LHVHVYLHDMYRVEQKIQSHWLRWAKKSPGIWQGGVAIPLKYAGMLIDIFRQRTDGKKSRKLVSVIGKFIVAPFRLTANSRPGFA